MNPDLQPVAPGLNLLRFPLRLSPPGIEVGRNVTLIDLTGGSILVHSTAAFDETSLATIRGQGRPTHLLEATGFHDTHAADGQAALKDCLYLTPPGFGSLANGEGAHNEITPGALPGIPEFHLQAHLIRGMPKANEVAIYHPGSKTLIVADLLFNIPRSAGLRSRLLLRLISGLPTEPAVSRLYKMMIKDRPAFRESLVPILELDFENLIPGHGDPVIGGAKATLTAALEKAGLCP